jgi:hypothetical protein
MALNHLIPSSLNVPLLSLRFHILQSSLLRLKQPLDFPLIMKAEVSVQAAMLKLDEIAQAKAAPRDALNVIVPIGGVGSRFAREGYRFPKPLINIVGRPMILWMIDNLSLRPGDTLWMAVNEEVDNNFRIGQLVTKTFPNIDFRLLRLRYQTKGASETVGTMSQDSSYSSNAKLSYSCTLLVRV